MSNIIPPLLSNSPPPPPDIDEEDDDFGDFAAPTDVSFDCDNYSLPSTPTDLPDKQFGSFVPNEILDINRNSNEDINHIFGTAELGLSKDFCDKRKDQNSASKDIYEKKSNSKDYDECQVKVNERSRFEESANLGDEKHVNCRNNESGSLKSDTPVVSDILEDFTTQTHFIEDNKPNSVHIPNEINGTNCDIKETSMDKNKSKDTSKESVNLIYKSIHNDLTNGSVVSNSSSTNNKDLNNECIKYITNSFIECESHIRNTDVDINFKNVPMTTISNDVTETSSELNDSFNKNKTMNTLQNTFLTTEVTIDRDVDINKEKEQAKTNYQAVINTEEDKFKIDSGFDSFETGVQYTTEEKTIKDIDSDDFVSVNKTSKEKSDANSEPILFEVGSNKTDREDSDDEFSEFKCSNNSNFTSFVVGLNKIQDNSDNEFANFKYGSHNAEHKSFEYNSNKVQMVQSDDKFASFKTGTYNSDHTLFEDSSDKDQKDKSDDEFADFKCSHNISQTFEDNSNTFQKGVSDIEFADFKCRNHNSEHTSIIVSSNKTQKDELGNEFVDFQCSSNNSEQRTSFDVDSSNVSTTNEDDDFGEFASTSNSENDSIQIGISTKLLLNEKEAFDKSVEILKKMFPVEDVAANNFQNNDFTENDKIFNKIKNVTETHALSFHWPKSASQNLLLKALNIDSRNILFGSGWNSTMPRFAANLSLTPLEPIKSESVLHVSTSAAELEPQSAVQFAVNSEINFGNLAEAEQFHSLSSKDTDKSLQNVKGADATLKIESESECGINKNNTEQKSTPIIHQEDFDDFVSYSEVPSSGHNVLLRETHISSKDSSKSEDDIVSWLEPTIVTPELSRRERQYVEPDEEFDDFQMTVPDDQTPKILDSSSALTVKPLENAVGQKPISYIEKNATHTFIKSELNKPKENDDEFGDFTFSLPKEKSTLSVPFENSKLGNSSGVVESIPTPALEPLKPSIVYAPTTSKEISWPDPGISEEEIKRFESLSYSRVSDDNLKDKHKDPGITVKNNIERKTSPVVDSSETLRGQNVSSQKLKQRTVDDDEWSDFVSVQSSPLHKIKSEKERSSTPDLPLSVLNLGNIQPTKQPIPVITPNGLVQTKLASNVSLNFPIMQNNRMYPQTQGQSSSSYQPSIISNQFASQAFGGFGNYQANTSTKSQLPENADDDEWSDFVSHEASSQKPSHPKGSWSNQPNQFSSWMSATPNIITNPTANLEVISSSDLERQKQHKRGPNTSTQSKKNSVPNMALPDLDFFSPRNRTNRK
ncbi:uncharacterized protein LOC115888981 [Sitophilus oryzae]|uniref:Uncharacterized protein LOC115888981 n=1 Tax=Sitophilus oryzae TaxID=7048 RepID=A0A6J2YPN5_SITOR|nr:uncharacterized protein LOC115888981 [Sitophilus oryzae]